MIHVLLTGQSPFDGDNFERLQARLRGTPRALDELLPSVPRALVDLSNPLLQRDPQRRPPRRARGVLVRDPC